jgi:hypothetical protein
MHKPATLLVELIGDEILENFIYEIMSEETSNKIIDFIIIKLKELQIHTVPSDIKVQMLTEAYSFDIFISEKLENKLVIFEKENPEYFI